MQNTTKEILIWGAGKIGRGFVADLFQHAGYTINFIDVNKSFLENLREQGQYTIALLPGEHEREERTIQGYHVYHTEQKEQIKEKIAECSLISVSVFPSAFEETAKAIAEGIEERALQCQQSGEAKPLDILLCTNILHPTSQFKGFLEANLSATGKTYLQNQVGFVETLIIRMAVEPSSEMKAKDPLIVVTNGYPEMPVDKTAFKGALPEVPGMIFAEDFAAEEIRKMYTYNMIHAVYAYLGKRRGYEYVIDCIRDTEIQQIAESCLDEVSLALQAEFGFDESDMQTWNARVLKNMANPILKDRVDRVGANPIRKLKREDRLTGPALLCRKHGILPYYLATAIAHAFFFDNERDDAAQELRQAVADSTIKDAVTTYCQLEREVELIQLISQRYQDALQHQSFLALPAEDIAKIKQAYQRGFYYEKTYKGCAQCTLAAMFDITGKREDTVFQAASGFSGGMGQCGDGVCGGYSGGIMMMSSMRGRRRDHFDGDREAKYASFDMAEQLHDKFLETYGTVLCKGVHQTIFGRSFDLRDDIAKQEFEQAGAHTDKCTTVVATAAQWITEILLKEKLLS